MVLSKVLFSIELLALVGVLFFLPATFLVEQKGDLNGRKSRFRGGVFLCNHLCTIRSITSSTNRDNKNASKRPWI